MTFGPFTLKGVEIQGDNLVLNLADSNGIVLYHPKRKLRYGQSADAKRHAEALIGTLVTTETFDPIKWPSKDWWLSVKAHVEKQAPVAQKSCTKIFGPPGTGKTTTLMNKVVDYICKGGQTDKIAFLTFTNNAANVAQERIIEAAQRHFPTKQFSLMDFPNFSTLHSLATRIGGLMGKNVLDVEKLRQFDPDIKSEVVWMKLGDASSAEDRPDHTPLAIQSFARARCITLEQAIVQGGFGEIYSSRSIQIMQDYFKNRHGRVVSESGLELISLYLGQYNKFKSENRLADFDDVIENAQSQPFFNDLPSFDLLIVDEAQDLSDLQWKLVKRLMAKANQIIIAGDDDQAIMVPFGASPTAFLELDGETVVLKQSYRVPKAVHDFVMEFAMPNLMDMFPERQKKDWLPTDKVGDVFTAIEKMVRTKDKTGQLGEPEVKSARIDLKDLLRIVKESMREEWLIMAPTKRTCQDISTGLKVLGVPHYLRNQPVLDPEKVGSVVRVMSIHTSKGDEADNAALVLASAADMSMVENDPRLKYVALTRAKRVLYPNV